MSYPVAYRRAAHRYQPATRPGFQRPSGLTSYGRAVNALANYNARTPLGGFAGGGVRLPPLSWAGRAFSAAIPPLRAAYTAWQLYQMWRELMKDRWHFPAANIPGEGYDLTGWQVECDLGIPLAGGFNSSIQICGPVTANGYRWSKASNGQVNNAIVSPVPISRIAFPSLAGYNTSGLADRADYCAKVMKHTPQVTTVPLAPDVKRYVLPEVPRLPQWEDPEQLPIGKPAVEWPTLPYWMLPYRRPNPNRAPVHQPQRGPGPVPRPGRAVWGYLMIYNAGARMPKLAPMRAPARPLRNVKERKIRARSAGAASLLRIAGAVSEVGDVVQAFHDALPLAFRARSGGHLGRLGALWDHWQDVNLGAAMENLIENFLEDLAYGKFGQVGKNSLSNNPYYGSVQGWQSGGLYRRIPNPYTGPSIGDHRPPPGTGVDWLDFPDFSWRDIQAYHGWH